MSFKITSWNVNSIKARLEHVKKYLETERPDILIIQELKGMEFPAESIESLGYKTEAVCQKSYNGVAVISRHSFETLHTKLPGFEEDEQARYIEINLNGLHIINIYLPNGNPAPGDKYSYKLKWMAHLKKHLENLRANNTPFVIGGDFNVMPDDIDCHAPQQWEGDALIRPETKQAYRAIINLGCTDAYRALHPNDKSYTFWDYQAGAWHKNNGIRIDHFLLSPEIADKLKACSINKSPRGWDRPSDHTPITVELDLEAYKQD